MRAVSGYALLVQEVETGLYGQFFIEADSHKYANGESTMSLTLAFQNVMEEVEIDNPKEEQKK